MHLHGQREVFPPGTVAEDSCWTFPGKFRIWMRVLYAALLPASCARARQSVGWAFTSRHCPGTAGCLPRQPPPGTHSSPAPGSCQAFPSQTGAVQNSECKKNQKNPSDRHSKITFSSRGSVAGDWLLVWPEKCLGRKGVSLAERSSTKRWAGHWCCWQEPGMLS